MMKTSHPSRRNSPNPTSVRRPRRTPPIVAVALTSLFVCSVHAQNTAAPPAPAAAAVVAAAPVIEFLSIEQARAAIGDESKYAYFSLLEPLEAAAVYGAAGDKLTAEQLRAAAKTRYLDAIETFSDAEQETLRWYVEQVESKLAGDFPFLTSLPWRFVRLRSDMVGGLPHTVSDCIMLSPRMLALLERMREDEQAGPVLAPRLMGMLIHERVHVLQRLSPEKFEPMYRDAWNFERAAAIEGAQPVIDRKVTNPDGADITWVRRVQQGDRDFHVWPLMVLGPAQGPPRFPDDAAIEGYSVEPVEGRPGVFRLMTDDDGSPLGTDLRTIDPYRRGLPAGTSIYHPHEIAAEGIENLLVHTRFMPGELTLDMLPAEARPVFQRLSDWLDAQNSAPAAAD